MILNIFNGFLENGFSFPTLMPDGFNYQLLPIGIYADTNKGNP
jgi:hypothetical protein